MNRAKVAKKVARRVLGYEASGDVEKVIADLLIQNTGVDDAPKEYFDKVKEKIKEVEDEDPKKVIEESEEYEDLTQYAIDVADEMELIEDWEDESD